MHEIDPRDATWASRFFSGRNAIGWASVIDGSAADDWASDIAPWFAPPCRSDPDAPMVVPLLGRDGTVVWYGVSRTARGAHRLAEDLLAAVGPSYSDFTGGSHEPDPGDDGEAALAEVFARPILRLRPTSAADVRTIRTAVARYRGLVERRPTFGRASARPFGMVRGEFDRAVLAGNESGARDAFEELLRIGRLSSENRLYLEVRLLAGLGLWPQLAGNSKLLGSLTDLLLPPRVLADVMEALYRVHAEPCEENCDVGGALRRFREAGVDRRGTLFGTLRGLRTPRVVKAFLLYETMRSPPDRERFETLAGLLGKGASDPFIAAMRSLIRDPAAASTGTGMPQTTDGAPGSADEAFDDDEFDRALDLYARLPPSAKSVRRMLYCATVIGDPVAAGRVVGLVDANPSALAWLNDKARNTLESLRQLARGTSAETDPLERKATSPPSGWLEWARLAAMPEGAARAETLLHRFADTWSVDGFASGADSVEEFCNLIGNAGGKSETAFRTAFPYVFCAFLIEPERPLPIFRPLYSTLLTMTALQESISQDDLELARLLIVALLSVGLPGREYEAAMLDLETLLACQRSVNTLYWALDVCEALAIYPSRDPPSRLRFVVAVMALAGTVPHRLSIAHRAAIRTVGRDFDIPVPAEIDASADADGVGDGVVRSLEDRTVAIYTLAEQAGRRAADMLRRICPAVKVVVNNDMVCTDRLALLARSADIFVFAWKSSKHQSFYCVKNNRPADLPLLHPVGKGSASILRAVLGHV